MYYGRDLQELNGVPPAEWEMEELVFHHFVMSQLSPMMNEQGISLHNLLIQEIERRGGLPRNRDPHP